MFASSVLMEKYGEHQKVFVDLEKAYDGVPREQLLLHEKSEMAER